MKMLLKDIDTAMAKEVQTSLNFLGYNVGTIDGIVGKNTLKAWGDWKVANWQSEVDYIGSSSLKLLKEQVASNKVFTKVHDFNSIKGTIAAIRWECNAQGLVLPTQQAYILATVDHETNGTFKPVREAYWLSEAWRKRNLRYYPYYGRGYVQIAWEYNYRHYENDLKLPLLKKPDTVMEPNVSLYILVEGSKNGIFTTRKLSEFIREGKTDYKNARKVINGLDAWQKIADLTGKYL